MSGIIEYNNENAPIGGYRPAKVVKSRATSLGHELKELGMRKKRLSDNTNLETDSHSDKQRRALQDFGNRQTGPYSTSGQRKPYSQNNVHVIKAQVHKSSNEDVTYIPGAIYNKSARLKRRNKDKERNAEIEVHPPPRKIPTDEPMDIENSLMKVKKVPPHGVLDIDLVNCPLLCSFYGQDIMNYLQARDTTLLRSAEYISKGEITNKMRGVLVDWLGQVQTFEGLTSESLHLCVFMIDRFLTLKLLSLNKLQLLGITCLLIASKVIERFPPEIPNLCQLTAGAYQPHEVLSMEKEVLNVLMFDLNVPGPIVFLDRYLQVDKHEEEIENLCLYLMDLSLTHTRFVQYSASRIAASALYLARFLFHSGPAWSPALIYYTKFTVDNLMACVRLCAMAVTKAETSTFQNARTKFNTKTFGHISMNPMLEKCRVLATDYDD